MTKKKTKPKRPREYNLVMPGLRVHDWHILGHAPSNKWARAMVHARCAICGEERDVLRYAIETGASRSCGCATKARFAQDRTRTGDQPRGARSITANSHRWLRRRYRDQLSPEILSYTSFLEVMGQRPSPAHHIRVIDTSAPTITAANLRWELRRGSTVNKNINREYSRAGRSVGAAEADHAVNTQ